MLFDISQLKIVEETYNEYKFILQLEKDHHSPNDAYMRQILFRVDGLCDIKTNLSNKIHLKTINQISLELMH